MAGLPVIALRLLDGRVGSTLLMQLLATSDEVVFEPGYPDGERRYLSYCLRIAEQVRTPWDPAMHPGVTDLLFGPIDRSGPIPFAASLVDVRRLGPTVMTVLWEAVSAELQRSAPTARYYAEKLVGETQLLIDSDVPVHLIDLIRDPRDVFCSIRAFTAGAEGFGRKPGQTDEEFFEVMAARQLQQLRLMTNTSVDVRRTVIRYEDLAAHLTSEADRLSNWLDLCFDPRQVLAATDDRRQHMTSAGAAESVGRWRRELEPKLAVRLWDQLGSMLEPFGYSAD